MGFFMKKQHVVPFAIMLMVGITGCAGHTVDKAWPEPRALGKDISTYRPPHQKSTTPLVTTMLDEPKGVVTLEQALSLALKNNPELAAFSWRVRAGEARTLQAGLLPNPEFEAEMEEFGGKGERRKFEGLETTLQFSQLIQLAGKRSKRKQVAALERDLTAWDYESKRLNVFTAVRKSFLEVLASQQKVTLNGELVKLSQQLLKTVSDRVRAGKTSPAEVSRAQVRLSARQVELVRARRELESSRQRLAATWGSQSPAFTKVSGTLDTLYSIPPQEKLTSLLQKNPDLARFEIALKQHQAVIALEDARRIPDPTISGGVRRFNETDDNAFVMGLSIPLPFYDRNQGARQEARYRLAQTRREKQALEVQLNAALSQTYNSLQSVYNEATTLKNEILPEAQNAYQTINNGYLQGRFDFLDVLDAQSTLFEARGQYIRALMEFHTGIAEIERLITQDIKTVN